MFTEKCASIATLLQEMPSKDLHLMICSVGSLIAVVVVYVGLLTRKKHVTRTGQVLGALDLALCVLYLLLYL